MTERRVGLPKWRITLAADGIRKDRNDMIRSGTIRSEDPVMQLALEEKAKRNS